MFSSNFNTILEKILPLFLLLPSFFILLSYKKASESDEVKEKLGVQFKIAKKNVDIYRKVNKVMFYIYLVVYFLQVLSVLLSKFINNFSNNDVLNFIIITYLISILISYLISIILAKKYK